MALFLQHQGNWSPVGQKIVQQGYKWNMEYFSVQKGTNYQSMMPKLISILSKTVGLSICLKLLLKLHLI